MGGIVARAKHYDHTMHAVRRCIVPNACVRVDQMPTRASHGVFWEADRVRVKVENNNNAGYDDRTWLVVVSYYCNLCFANCMHALVVTHNIWFGFAFVRIAVRNGLSTAFC